MSIDRIHFNNENTIVLFCIHRIRSAAYPSHFALQVCISIKRSPLSRFSMYRWHNCVLLY